LFHFGAQIALHTPAMADETTIENKDQKQEIKKSLRPIVLIGAVLILAGAGGGGWYFLHHGKTAEAAPKEVEVLHTVHLEGFTVNLADAEENHFLRITLDLGLTHAVKAGKEGESDMPTARVRDAILTVLTAGKSDALVTQDGKAQLKKDILSALQQSVPELGVREVYFTEFLVQR
jgi:flagellar FliL protein